MQMVCMKERNWVGILHVVVIECDIFFPMVVVLETCSHWKPIHFLSI